MHAQAERSGIITTLDGNLHITVPYTFTFTATNGQSCCSFLDGQVFLEIFGPGSNGELGQDAKDVFHSEFAPQSFSQSGTVDWNLTGLTPGTYEIDVGAASSSTFVPEPGTLLLLGIGTVGLGLRSRRGLSSPQQDRGGSGTTGAKTNTGSLLPADFTAPSNSGISSLRNATV